MRGQNPREIAARVLGQRRRDGDFTEELLDRALNRADLPSPDRRLCQELVYGIVRWQVALDWLIARKTNGREQDAALQNLLRLGLYQIFWLDRIPAHAAVHETVELAKRGGFEQQAGFVNAVLRSFVRETDATRILLAELKTTDPALGWSHPEWLVARWQKNFGAEKTAQLLKWNNTPPKTFARVNTLAWERRRPAGEFLNQNADTPAGRQRSQENTNSLLARWREEGVEYDSFTRDWLGENLIFELKSHPPLASLASFREGWFYVQDPSTLLAPILLAPQPGESILDFCAAPGGKTTFIAQLMQNQGRIVASDNSEERLKLIQDNCRRLGITCIEGQLISPHAGPLPPGEGESQSVQNQKDGSRQKYHQTAKGGAKAFPSPAGEGQGEGGPFFDRILVDVPCSNTGVMRRRVDLRWRVTPQEISRLQKKQLALLQKAAAMLKPGGVLVYSTCSLEPEENSEVVREFVREHKNFKLETERQLLPFADNVDGAYVAKFGFHQ